MLVKLEVALVPDQVLIEMSAIAALKAEAVTLLQSSDVKEARKPTLTSYLDAA